MPTTSTSLLSTAPNTNYNDPVNWTNGAPAQGYNVILAVAPPNGPETATNTAIVGQSIFLSNNAQFFTAGTTTLDSTTTVTDGNQATNLDIQLSFNVTSAATFINPNYIFIGVQSSANPAPLFTNNGTISYNTNLGGTSLSAYQINGFNSSGAVELTNNGTIAVVDAAGANEGPTATTLDTQVQITGVVSGTGQVNVDGSAQNSTSGPSATAPTESVVEFEQAVTGSMTFNLNDGEAQFDAASSGTVNFQDSSGILDLANVVTTPSALAILGFRLGDDIGLGTKAVTSAAYDAATKQVDLFNATNVMVGSLNIGANGVQNYSGATFTVATSLAADTLLPTSNSTRTQNYLQVNLAVPCYCPGTSILTDKGEVAIERLAIGDRVITLDGTAEPVRWIGRRSYDGRFVDGRRDILPVCITAGAFAPNQPKRDLWVSPLHAMLIAGHLVPASALINGVSVLQATACETVEYLHIELANHGVIWAEGAAAETFVDDNSRAMFQNAAEYLDLYPDSHGVEARYCADRIEDGEMLETIKRTVDARAGLHSFAPPAPLRGFLDSVDGLVVQGWAQNPANPEAPVCLELRVDGEVVDRGLATVFRQDLRVAGIGSGYHGFRLTLPPGQYAGSIEVCRAGDGARIVPDRTRQAA